MTKNKLHIFSREFALYLKLCETQSLKETADQFGVSSSTASRMLSKLENDLGFNLFDRSTRPMNLTPQGRWLVHELKPGLDQARNAIENMQKQSSIKPDLRIGFVDSFTYCVAPEFIRRISPSISHLTCLTGSSDRLIERLRANELDIIISSDPAYSLEKTRRLFFLQEPSVIVLPKSNQFSTLNSSNWSQFLLCGLPYISSYGKSGGGILATNFLKTMGLKLLSTMNVDNIGLKLKLIAQNKGWSITRTVGFLNHLDILDELKVVALPPPGLTRKLYLISSESMSYELYVACFNTLIDVLKEQTLPQLNKIVPWLLKDFYLAEKIKS